MSNTIQKHSIRVFKILGVRISAINMVDACRHVKSLIDQKKKGYVIVCPVSTIMECFYHPHIKEIVNKADLVTPDGMPSWLTLNWRNSFYFTKKIQLQFAIENILDRNYRYFASGFSAPGRNYVIALRTSF